MMVVGRKGLSLVTKLKVRETAPKILCTWNMSRGQPQVSPEVHNIPWNYDLKGLGWGT